ncbi:MAG: hypothetical protein IJ473_00345 [Alphaproteobacteria bacterium]|nr:hypothetical protein [Alphaproteobacteria bacterium]MBQ8660019.1 hypothetical protein [Alphaproteobacteria bacterium]
MANKNEMFEGGVVKLDFLAKEESDFNKAMAKINEKATAEKNAQDMANVVAGQKRGSSK